jgi:hypothetical protein
MKEEPDFYKRKEDKDWREQTDTRLNALTTSDNVQNDRLDEIDQRFEALDALLEGDPKDKNDSGIKGDVHDLSRRLNELRALMAPDNLGQGGVLSRLKALEKKEERETRQIEYRWKFWTALLVAGLSLAGLLVKEWPMLRTFIDKPAVSAPAKPKKHRRVRSVAPAPTHDEETPNAEPQTSH